MTTPRLFISYNWSTPEHDQWVVDLATELRESGIDVVLDKWDLKEGHDALVFMETMVNDPSITKVAIISDEAYATKADGRTGGVGTETQIISAKVYQDQAQEKFVAVLPVKDSNGKPFLPTYYKSRIYIDLSDSDRYAENFDKLLRWVYDKPLHVKPPLGATPAYLTEGTHPSLGTGAAFKRCVEALKNAKPYSAGAVDDYFTTFVANLERFRITRADGVAFDDAVVSSIEEFTPYRNELIQLLTAIAKYAPSTESIRSTHRFFEQMVPYMNRPETTRQWQEFDFDNFKFIVHELLLYAIAIFVRHERFEFVNALMTLPYYAIRDSGYGEEAVSSAFRTFRVHLKSLERRNERLSLKRLSVRADMLKQRAEASGVAFKDIMQADFIVFMRAAREHEGWYPETLMYAGRSYSPLEVFARCASKSYFERAKCILGVEKPEDLAEQLDTYKTSRSLPSWQGESFDPRVLLGFENMCTRP